MKLQDRKIIKMIASNCALPECQRNELDRIARENEPVKPVMYGEVSRLFLCGRCSSTFIRSPYGIRMLYCPNCGAEQDWSDYEQIVE